MHLCTESPCELYEMFFHSTVLKGMLAADDWGPAAWRICYLQKDTGCTDLNTKRCTGARYGRYLTVSAWHMQKRLTSRRTSAAVNLSMTSTMSNATMSVSGIICRAWKSAGRARPSSCATSWTKDSGPSPTLYSLQHCSTGFKLLQPSCHCQVDGPAVFMSVPRRYTITIATAAARLPCSSEVMQTCMT